MCCLMACLLKVLSDMLQNPQLLSHIHICPKPKVKLRPTDSFYPEPPSSIDIATARNSNQFGLTEMGLQTLRYLLQLFRSHRDKQSVPRSLSGQLSILLITKIGPTEFV